LRLIIDPHPALKLFQEDLHLVVGYREDKLPEIYQEEGMPKPDRHLLIGLFQSALIAIEEQDPESVVFIENGSIRLARNRIENTIAADLLTVRTIDGRIGCLVFGLPARGRRLARNAVRHFTRTVRLDIP